MGPRAWGAARPIFDEKKLRIWLYETAMRLSYAAMVLLPDHPEGHDLKLLATQAHYLEVVNKWWSKYRRLNVAAGGA